MRSVVRSSIRSFALAAAAVASLPGSTLVLDGEVAIFDQQLRSRFDLLQHSDPEAVATPPVYIAFDLLYRTGSDVSGATSTSNAAP